MGLKPGAVVPSLPPGSDKLLTILVVRIKINTRYVKILLHSFHELLPSRLQLFASMEKLVFIIEDDLAQQKMLQYHFEQMLGSYRVRCFAHPEEMLKHLHEKPFAVVLDHFFSDSTKTGLDYLELMKKKYSSIPVIYYTSLTDEQVKAKVMALKAEQYIVKDPASLVRLRTALDSIHEKSGKKGFLGKLFGAK